MRCSYYYEDKIYTIRTIEEKSIGTFIRLNEFINQPTSYSDGGRYEIQFNMSDFRPLDYNFVEEVMEMINNEQFHPCVTQMN